MRTLTLDLRDNCRTAMYAFAELKKYLLLIDPELDIRLGADGITLRVDPDSFKVEAPELDDAVRISVENGRGEIAASNPRALLIAVYRFLHILGARFIKPGKDGERIPFKPLENLSAHYAHAASSRHRGICIEGSVSLENVLNTVEWMPKVGLNAYFIQFMTPFTFFQRWYGHEWNVKKTPERLTKTLIDGFTGEIRAAAALRGIVNHAVGHGWTCEPLGIPGLGWYADRNEYPESEKYFALVDGKRGVWKYTPLNTNLCYGNPEVEKLMTDAVVSYCRDNPEVDVVQFWLADGANNQCECPLCRDIRPADHYVRMLNTIDRGLAAAGLKTRVVFLLYVDLLWPPVSERLENPERFIMMFAPISRRYSEPLREDGTGKMSPFERNRLVFPKSTADSLAYLRAWQAAAPGCDSFIFDYHFMWDYIKEPGGYAHAGTLFNDMKNLASFGLNGMVSCQNQRVFFPTALGMQGMAAALWDSSLEFEGFAAEFFSDAFGEYGAAVGKYLQTLSELYPANVVRHEESPSEGTLAAFGAAAELCESFGEKLGSMKSADRCIQSELDVLRMHGALTVLNARLCAAKLAGDGSGAEGLFAALSELAAECEDKMRDEFDLCLYLGTVANFTVGGKRWDAPPLED